MNKKDEISGTDGASPLVFLKHWARTNPASAAIVFGGIACFAAVALVSAFGIDFQSNIAPVFYILGVGLFLAIATQIINSKIIMSVICWFFTILLILWVLSYIALRGAPLSTTARQQLSCVVYFWLDCKETVDSQTVSNVQSSETPNNASTFPAPSDTLPSPPKAVRPSEYTVSMQFAGTLTRDSIRELMRKLKEQGWNVEGVAGGGERTAKAAGLSEIRYSGDPLPAEILAKAVQSSNLAKNEIKAVRVSSVPEKTLEIWISR
ncbi:hypothetical protein E3C22_19625 [Jiella endophytica]|uniref:Uncharacterized protein n=1 Tax=Jiella endophytica TaxID=2558362 RepID=A0A4Y8RCX4_9HYPH|nr:hypothetical protein [Jiella endophytica]TFF19875.1 hypothetical protein E3C22_19625 [Jiella endophytica]